MAKGADRFKLSPIEPVAHPWEPTVNPEDIVVPGLDASAPLQDQIEQIDQLITIKLQNIDANFARSHQILTTKILPAVRRYAVNTEPVREAARFWISFFEQAAQVRIPTADDFEDEVEQQYEEDEDMHTEGHESRDAQAPPKDNSTPFDPNVTPSESSFTPDALVSSTPMIDAHTRQQSAASEETPSWEASIESPFERLDKGLRSLGQVEEDSIMERTRQNLSEQVTPQSIDASTARAPVFTAQQKGKGKAQPPSLLQSVLEKSIRDGDSSARKHTSPLKVRQKIATPKRKNPYARSDAARAQWDGIVDLSQQRAASRDANQDEWSSGDEEHTFQPHDIPKPSSSRFASQVGRTPVREAAARIGKDLVGRVEQSRQPFFSGTKRGLSPEPDSPESPGTPVLSLYSRRALGLESEESLSSAQSGSLRNLGMDQDASHLSAASGSATTEQPSLRGMMRQFGLDAPSESYASSTSHQFSDVVDAGGGPEDSFEDSFDDDTPAPPVFASLALQGENMDTEMDSDSDSDDDGRPGAGFLMASAQQSYDSDHSSDSLNGGGGGNGMHGEYADDEAAAEAPIHPFARGFVGGGDGMDDSAFDDSFDEPAHGAESEEATLFGVGQPAQHGRNLQLLGQGLVDDTTALNQRLRPSFGGVPETPTPWTGPGS